MTGKQKYCYSFGWIPPFSLPLAVLFIDLNLITLFFLKPHDSYHLKNSDLTLLGMVFVCYIFSSSLVADKEVKMKNKPNTTWWKTFFIELLHGTFITLNLCILLSNFIAICSVFWSLFGGLIFIKRPPWEYQSWQASFHIINFSHHNFCSLLREQLYVFYNSSAIHMG